MKCAAPNKMKPSEAVVTPIRQITHQCILSPAPCQQRKWTFCISLAESAQCFQRLIRIQSYSRSKLCFTSCWCSLQCKSWCAMTRRKPSGKHKEGKKSLFWFMVMWLQHRRRRQSLPLTMQIGNKLFRTFTSSLLCVSIMKKHIISISIEV